MLVAQIRASQWQWFTSMKDDREERLWFQGEGCPEDAYVLSVLASELLLKLFPSSWKALPAALHTHPIPSLCITTWLKRHLFHEVFLDLPARSCFFPFKCSWHFAWTTQGTFEMSCSGSCNPGLQTAGMVLIVSNSLLNSPWH